MKITWQQIKKLYGFKKTFSFLEASTPAYKAWLIGRSFHANAKLTAYLADHGYRADDEGIEFTNLAALHFAHALFDEIEDEYESEAQSGKRCAEFDIRGEYDELNCAAMPIVVTEFLIQNWCEVKSCGVAREVIEPIYLGTIRGRV